MDDTVEDLVHLYFELGHKQEEIICFLALRHGIHISLRKLQRILQHLNLYRRKHFADLAVVVSFLQEELQYSSQLHGYKWMYRKCLQSGLVTTQNTIRLALQLLDKDGVFLRKRKRLRRRQYFNKGANFLWHLDSYDKLKPFGICVNGCIDGFSRYILWLRAAETNNNPKVIGGYYIDTVKNLGGCPRCIRADMGTENVEVKAMQTFLKEQNRQNYQCPPFLVGKSPANQRIESWWSILRKYNVQFWLNLFNKIKDDTYFNGDFIDKSLIRFCFMELIQVR